MLERSHCRLVNDENEEGAQGPDIPVVVSHRSSDFSSISCSLELLRVVKGRVSDRGARFFVLVMLGGMCPRA